MYIQSFEIENVRSIARLKWKAPRKDRLPGWHVLIGDNGSGKSTVLRAVALALVGSKEAAALRQSWATWLRRNANSASIQIVMQREEELKGIDTFTGSGRTLERQRPVCGVELIREAGNGVSLLDGQYVHNDPRRHVWGPGVGWFSAGFGPFRRFTGGDKEFEKIFYSNPRLGRHLSLFGEAVALSECLTWLQQLQFRKLEARERGTARLLKGVLEFVNTSEALPHGARIGEITSEAVEIVDGNRCRLPAEDLSDGYRSVLSMTFELIRQLVATYGPDVFDPEDPTKVKVPGVVLIDEVDAHLHPDWQTQIGMWLTRSFPRIQFIVTTHSPLVCQAAELGSVFRLPAPGSDEAPRMLEGLALERLLYGNVLDAYSTEQFGEVKRSVAGRAKLRRLAELNQRELHAGLSKKERVERDRLRASLPTRANATTADDEPAS